MLHVESHVGACEDKGGDFTALRSIHDDIAKDKMDCVRGFPEACRAWTILVAGLVDRLRAAPRRCSYVPLASGQNSIINSTLSVSSLELRRFDHCGTPQSLPDIEIAALEKALPHVRSSNPALASIN
ncbi:unnamed protein product [Angiostrongylus costaricensis]|uniref:RNase H domain-containing protein n=1 Tax=Angiostrongylus costaricensis TaxID=334426 RepID=A0A0R3PS11_ANGCS|nr:unnamed protein product [Angiostrongylus costaricensis]